LPQFSFDQLIVSNIFIHRIDGVLGCYFAARYLETAGNQVFYAECEKDCLSRSEILNLIFQAIRETAEKGSTPELQEIERRLCQVGKDIDVHALALPGCTPINEFWCFANSGDRFDSLQALDGMVRASAGMGAGEFNYVESDSSAPEAADGDSSRQGTRAPNAICDDDIAQCCKSHNLKYRIFHTSFVLGNGSTIAENRGSAFSQFLSVLHALKSEIEERSPQYFEFQALRCAVPIESRMNVISANAASDLLCRIARAEGTADSSFRIGSSHDISVSDVCERIGIAYNLSFLPARDEKALNAVDRAFNERLKEADACLMGGREYAGMYASALDQCSPKSALLDEESQIAYFETVRKNQDRVLAARRQRAAELPSRLERKTAARSQSELNYYAGGKAGTPVIILNALGQGLEYWYRLLDSLMDDHRVIIWEPRGTVHSSPPFGVSDQVDDVDSVLQQEGIESCHLVGWCTGPKIAIDFHLRRPSAVRSMSFLNGTLKCDGAPDELDSPYEHYLESLLRMLVRKPTMAGTVKRTLQSREEPSENEILEGADGEEVSVSVLSRMNGNLKSQVLAPFRTEETTINYAHQMVDFWTHDARPKAGRVEAPVLLMSAEYDQIANPAASVAAAELLPRARHIHVKGATHYCFYDRPEFVSGLLMDFFANPDSFVAQRQ
jgi:pimeloyl-ACP methyl ester carboxylesterase